MVSREQEALLDALVHCEMLRYVMQQEHSPLLIELGVQSRIPMLVNQFTFMHLFSTLFAIDGKDRPLGGAVYVLLDRVGEADILEDVAEVLRAPVGETTYCDYIRLCRNKLAVHGDLDFGNLPSHIQAVTYDPSALEQYEATNERFASALDRLRSALNSRIRELEAGPA